MEDCPTKMTMIDGTEVDLLNPDLSAVSIEVIAAGLAKICRFNGQCGPADSIYSVAQHCVLVSEQCDPQHALWGLLHDTWEAFFGDDIAPKKRALGRPYVAVEHRGDRAVADRFGLPWPIPQNVKDCDLQMRATEHRDLRKGALISVGIESKPYPFRIEVWDIPTARWRFLDRYYQLMKE